jgi:hypothetical protein
MAADDLILAPENLQAILQGLDGLRPVLGPEAAPGLERVRELLQQALNAQADARMPDALSAITLAMRELVQLANRMDPSEAAIMQAVAARFEQAMHQGDLGNAAESLDQMRERSGATKRSPEDTEL